MDLGELRTEVSYLIGFKSGSPDQDFTGPSAYTNQRIDSAINEAVRKEYRLAVSECSSDPFSRRLTFTWAASDQTRKLPSGITRDQIIALADTTSDVRGVELWVGGRFSSADIIWNDYQTLEWGRSGPGSDRTITVDYIARPVKMSVETHRPDIFPEAHHDLLVWSAAVLLRKKADEAAPQAWLSEIKEQRAVMHKFLERENPIINNREINVPYYEGV